MPKQVYVLVRRNPDIMPHMVEIKGIFNSRIEAAKYREMIFSCGINVEIETYNLLDTLEDV